MYFLNIAGLLLYMAFRIIILPLIVLLYSLWMAIVLVQGIVKITGQLRTLKLKPIEPLYRFVKFRLNLSK